MDGHVALVTGAARGIGAAVAKELLEKGCKVLLCDILTTQGENTKRELLECFGDSTVDYMRVDVASADNMDQAFQYCINKWGRLDIVINNAGINAETNWETQLDINLKGTIRGTKLAVKYMGAPKGRGGTVVNISSIQGLLHWPAMPTYSAGKAGIVAYTRCAGHEDEWNSHNVKIMALCPFGVDTPMQDFEKYTGMTEVGKDFLTRQDVGGDILSGEDVAKAVSKIIQNGKTASVWYLHKHGDEAVEVPDTATWDWIQQLKP